jgi:membrane-associated phospholipid phosphatase
VPHANGLDSGVRNALKWHNTARADLLSNIGEFGVMPLATLGFNAVAAHHDGKDYQLLVDGLMVAEAAALAMDVNQIVKFAVGRERPFVSALPDADKPHTAHPADNNVSFFSGHTTFAFSLAVGAGTVASARGYRWAPWVWAAGLTFGTTVGYLRIAADKHYFTDVITGAAVGTLFGWGIPYLHKRTRTGKPPPIVTIDKTRDSAVLGVRWVF